ncbi:MAG TPA: hypothetical protein VFV36_09995 [Candidatus Methylomirabilis sp.]|nr:hypothetical protein [Candidatus Methylomirabilis sp.]
MTAVAALALLWGAVPAAAAPPAEIDAKSAPLVDALMGALGGLDAWNGLPAIRFDFVAVKEGKELARRRHWWDKTHGLCRVEWADDQGRSVAAVVNLDDRTGRSCTAGAADSDTLLTKHVQEAYAMWVNDTYWLAMPFKLRDPGVRIAYDRSEERPQGGYDVLSLTFGDVGLTPEDHYWLFLNRETGRIDRWEYVLQGQKPPPQAATWEDWRRVGPVTLPLLRTFDQRPANLRFENVEAPPSFDDRILRDPCARG